ncbi:hypothetical protein BDN72DRAFT_850961 [Pluteus cervinus]|uniref:Uncharacterized protein n=1 Tax=Pluteus cervinus TaxID=181527 RepID=A0ACD3A2J9_9AGAR|nr:hypothetical protein BDN72DRAFT_850961 [Pluteus cervinus]
MSTANDILEHAQAKIDAQILDLQERIRSLRSSRNALSLIHRLPPEVMTQIFRWLQLFYRGNMEQDGRDAASLTKWIEVTHVSQYWRDIALNSKALYSTILTHNLAYSKEVLKLSGSAALSLVDSVDFRTAKLWDTEELRDLIVAALPRIRNLWLGNWGSTFLEPHIKQSNLVLEELCLWRWRPFIPTLFPSSLRYLRLYWCPFESYEWLPRLSSMVELVIIGSYDQLHMTVDTILNILDQMPRLISLELAATCESISTQGERASRITPQLQYLKVYDPLDPIIELLLWLTFAPRFIMDLNIRTPLDSTVDSLPILFEQVGRHLRASSMVHHTAKFIWDPNSYGRESDICISEGIEEKPYFQYHRRVRESDSFRTWLTATKALPLGDIESLTMDMPYDASDWCDTPWHGTTTLRRLVLPNEQASSTFLEYLTSPAGIHAPFKSLEELSLHDIHYGREFKSKVQATLSARNKLGFKLRKLAFHHCNISGDSIKQLSKVVDEVEQDGGKKKGKKGNRA